MFKKFNPKEDVASSTSLKSSAQRHIRTGLLEQIPFLAQPVNSSTSSTSAPSSAPPPLSATEEVGNATGEDQDNDGPEEIPELEAVETSGKKSGGKGGGKKGGKGGGGKKDKGGGGGNRKNKDNAEEQDEKEATATGAGGEDNLLVIDEIWPKKEALGITKCLQRVSIYTLDGAPLIWQHFEGPFIPTLQLLHKYPDMLPHVRIDRGAIKFLLSGANMMAPGLLSPGGDLPPSLPASTIVAIHAEGKQHACGIGKLVASSEEIRKKGKDVAVEVMCYVGDDLWKVDKLA